MLVFNNFKCPECQKQDEYFVDNRAHEVVCRSCGATATKMLNVPLFHLSGTDSGFPTAYDKWAKKREQKLKEEQRNEIP